MTSYEKAVEIIKILNEKDAKDIKLLYVEDKTIIADYFIICSGNSNTQVKSYADEIEYKMELKGIKPHHSEGFNEAKWTVMDYDTVIVHLFYSETREYYNLEKLWSDAKEIDISEFVTQK